jgi:hypothetical protein
VPAVALTAVRDPPIVGAHYSLVFKLIWRNLLNRTSFLPWSPALVTNKRPAASFNRKLVTNITVDPLETRNLILLKQSAVDYLGTARSDTYAADVVEFVQVFELQEWIGIDLRIAGADA